MGTKGWKYLKMGECSTCEVAGARLYVPVLDGTPLDIKGMELVNGIHIPHFAPVCRTCCRKFNLEQVCQDHKLLTKGDTGLCNLCIRTQPSKITSDQGSPQRGDLAAILKRLYRLHRS
jgi:hypothetical protein